MPTYPSYQNTLFLNTLYKISLKGGIWGAEQLAPSLEVIGGTINVYGSQWLPVSPPANMSLTREDYSGIDRFGVIPSYLYMTQYSGTTNYIITSGLDVKVV